MDKSMVTIVDGGRITRNRMRRQNHFSLKKTFDKIGDGIRQGSQEVFKKVAVEPVIKKSGGNQQTINDVWTDPEVQKIRSKFGSDSVKMARDVAISVGTLGVGSAASGIKGAAEAGNAVKGAADAAKAAKAASTVSTAVKGIKLADAAKAATAAGGLITAVKSKDPKKAAAAVDALKDTKLADKISNELGVSQKEAADLSAEIKASDIAQKVTKVADEIPDDIKKQLVQKGKVKIEDVIANNRVSKELLPKTKKMKDAEDLASLKSDTATKSAMDQQLSNKIGGFEIRDVLIAVVVLVVLFMIFKKM